MIRERLLREMFFTSGLRGLLVMFALLLLPLGMRGQTSIKVAGNEPDAKGDIKGAGINGSITFDASTNTLTLDNATLTGAVESSLSNLTIHLKGNNWIKGTDDNNKLDNGISSIVATAKLTFTSDISEGKPTGKLYFQYVTKPIDGFSSITYNSGLDQGFIYNNQGGRYLGIGEIEYGLSIGEIKVTSANYLDIIVGGYSIGSYDKAATHILTLNGATLTVPISWTNDENFKIELIGTNKITTSGSCITTTANGKNISFKRGGACSLELSAGTASVISGFSNCEYPTMDTRLYWFPTYGATDNISSAIVTTSLLSGGAGTSGSPFEIKDFDDLKNFATYVNEGILTTEYVKLKDNITCGTGFVPIGNSDYAFAGHFDGDGKTISGLQYGDMNPDVSIGLFERINGGTVKNLTLSGCSFSGGTKTGAIVGYFQAGTIQNCKVSSSTVESGDANIGAIVGYKEDEAILSNNSYDADVTVSKTVGGATTTKSGYDQRGIGNGNDEIGIVELAGTKKVKVLVPDAIGYASSEVADGSYYLFKDDFYYLLPGNDFTFSVTPMEGYKPVLSLSVGSVSVSSEDCNVDGHYDHTVFTFTMPNADVTATLSFSITDAYDLKVGGKQVTERNKDEIMGVGNSTVRFDGEHTLTLNGAVIDGAIESGLGNLTIHLTGNSTIAATGSETSLIKSTNGGTLTFETDGLTAIGSLSFLKAKGASSPFDHAPFSGFSTVAYGDGLYYDDTGKIVGPAESFDFENPFSSDDQVWCTYYSALADDLTLPENLEAYFVTSVGESSVDITSVGYLPKGVPLLLKRTGTLGTKVTTYSGSAGSFTDNKLQAAPTGGIDVSTIAGTVYVLYNGEFVKSTSGTIPAGKCYLVVSSPSAARVLIIDDATAIDCGQLTVDSFAGAVYDLQGRKIRKPAKAGLFIVNGKKIVIK
jgi:hypothetical protein